MSVQHDDGTGSELRTSSLPPRQRTDPTPLDPGDPATVPLAAGPARHSAPEDANTPTQRLPARPPGPVDSGEHEQTTTVIGAPTAGPANPPRLPVADADATVVLPEFLTGLNKLLAAESLPVVAAEPEERDTALGGSERGMLIFVAALLVLGAIAVVAMMGFGLTGGPKPKPKPPSPAAVVPVPAVASPSPTASPSPSPEPASPSPVASSSRPTPRRSTASASASASPRPVLLGALAQSDLAGYCAVKGYTLRPPGGPVGRLPADPNWNCVGPHGTVPFDIVPTEVCRWRFVNNSATTAARNPTDPLPWKCYA